MGGKVNEELRQLIEKINNETSYEVNFVYLWPMSGTVDSLIFETYEYAKEILGDQSDSNEKLEIVPVILKKGED